MPRDAHIPLFLWIATALLVHLVGGGGAHEAAEWVEERIDLQRFANNVRTYVKSGQRTVEISLPEDLPPEPPPPEEKPSSDADAKPEPDDDAKEEESPTKTPEEEKKEEELAKAEEQRKKEEKKEKEKKPEEKKPEEKKAEPLPEQLVVKKAIAVRQHVEDEKQPENKDAEFLADHNNRVREQTQARITSNDQDDPKPTPGSSSSGVGDQPGNAHETRIAHSEDRAGDAAQAPSDEPAAKRPDTDQPPPNAGAPEAVARAHTAPAQNGVTTGVQQPPGKEKTADRASRGSAGQAEQKADPGAPDLLAAQQGLGAAPAPRTPTVEQQGRRGQRHRELPRRKIRGYEDLLGLGASGTTASGINLNLTPGLARDAIGMDQLTRERRADGARRRSQHLGSWKMAGIERWRSAIENYVPMVKPGNQTALNTARSPFGRYLASIHNLIHPIFADWFLASLDSLPAGHPMNRPMISTNLEIVLDEDEGRVVKMGVTKTSGVTAFDVQALDSVQRAGPFGPPPREIVSPDGNVYLHWEFHRNPLIACTTYHARPYILKVKPKSAPPPALPPPDDERPPEEQHGSRRLPSEQRMAVTP